jgi:hypothetical protein
MQLQGLEEILKRKMEYNKKATEVREFDIKEISVRDKLQQTRKEKCHFGDKKLE